MADDCIHDSEPVPGGADAAEVTVSVPANQYRPAHVTVPVGSPDTAAVVTSAMTALERAHTAAGRPWTPDDRVLWFAAVSVEVEHGAPRFMVTRGAVESFRRSVERAA